MKFPYLLTHAMIVMSVSAFSENKPVNKCETWLPGEPLGNNYSPSYNMGAAIDVKHQSGIDVFGDLSFTYWLAQEDGLMLAYISLAADDFSPNGMNGVTSEFVFQTSEFKPGFKVGLGIVGNHEWVIHGEYTWYRAKNTTHAASHSDTLLLFGPTTPGEGGTKVWFPSPWFVQNGIYATKLSTTWDVQLDLADVTAGRPFYQSRNVVINPFGGLRAAWIRQSLTMAMTESPISQGDLVLTPQPTYSRNHSHSWGVGPRIGVNTEILLPAGFQLEGNFAASLLYTRYTTLSHSETAVNTDNLPSSFSLKDYGCLRPSAELGLGIGWGTYLASGKYHLNFSADYDFMIFWSQNMIRMLMDNVYVSTGASAGDLYLQGLTISSRFDF